MKLTEWKEKIKDKQKSNSIVVNKVNYDMLSQITSHTPFSFHELYYIHANKYHTCLQIFKFPERSFKNFFGSLLDDKDIYVTIDCDHLSKNDYYDKFNKIIKINEDESDSTRDLKKSKDKIEEIREMNSFDNELKVNREETKTITVRIYLCAISLEKLQKKLDDTITLLIEKGMNGYVQTNDLETDVKALTTFSNPVKQLVMSSTISDILLKSEISKVDECGSLVGYTNNGVYAPDIYSFKNNSYNCIALGGMGAGKSAFLKTLEEGYYCLGNHTLHIFDIHGEYTSYGKKLGIPIVAIDDKNTVNVCQMFYTLRDDGLITKTDITSKIAVLVETFKTCAMENRKNVIDHFEKEFKRYFDKNVLDKNIHDLKNDDWFVMSDILDEINRKYENKEYEDQAKKDIYNLRLSFSTMLEKYGFIYNQKTNMNFDLTNSMIFDISFFDKVQDKKIKSAYVSLLMDYMSMAVRLHLEKNNAMMEEKGVYAYQLKRPFYTYRLLVDETLDYAEDSGFLLKTLNLLKYMRKAYAGATFVIHTLDETRKKVQAGENEESYLGQIFSLCTNKFVGSTDGASLNDLPLIVKSMNTSDVSIVSTFKKGNHGERQFLVVDDQKKKYYITSIVNPFQRKYFGGGA